MKHGSLFSGIGGFDLAAEWMGWDNVFHCEWNEFGQRVLKHYWPKAISYEDITKTDFTIHRGQLDILTGGFPCQPYSQAGKRLGKDDERHLWPEMLRAIHEIQPRWVVGENVLGLVNWSNGLVFEEVQADLENQGYEVQPYVLPAAAVNAPHKRDRVWFVAKNTLRSRRLHRVDEQEGAEVWQQRNTCAGDSNRFCREEGVNASNPDSNGLHERHGNNEINPSEGRINAQRDIKSSNGNGDVADTKSRRQGRLRNEGKTAGTRESNQPFGGFCGVPHWHYFPTTEPTIRYGNDGISTRLDTITFSKWRNESIKAGGNAIVPQVALQIFKAIEHYEKPLRTPKLPA